MNIRLISPAAVILMAKISGMGLSLVSVTLIARALGATGRGEATALISVMILLPTILSFGFPQHLRQLFVSQEDKVDACIRTIRLFSLVCAVSSFICLMLVSSLYAEAFKPQSIMFLQLLAPVCVFTGILWICNSYVLVGRGATLKYSIITLLPNLGSVFIIILCYFFGELTVDMVVVAQGFAYILTYSISELFVKINFRGRHANFIFLLSGSSKYAGSQIISSLAFRLDQIIILPLTGAYVAGLYSISATIALLPFAVGQAMSSAYFRRLVAGYQDKTRSFDNRIMIRTFIYAGMLSILLGISASWSIPFVFGPEFTDAVEPTWIALIGGTCLALTQVTGSLLNIRKIGWRMTANRFFGLVVGTSLLVVMSDKLDLFAGSLGMTANFLCVLCLDLVVLNAFAKRRNEIR